jgi:hypothetical protein
MKIRKGKLISKVNYDLLGALIIASYFIIRLIHYIWFRKVEITLEFYGFENAQIANSLLHGMGFANPFPLETGPTAWTPPLYVLILWAIFKIFGVTLYSFIFISVLKLATFILSYFCLKKSANLMSVPFPGIPLALLFILYIFLQEWLFLCYSTEHWIYFLFISLMLYGTCNFIKNGKSIFLLFFLFLLIPVATPTLLVPAFFIYFFIFVFFLLKKSNFTVKNIFKVSPQIKLKYFIYFGFASVISISAWTLRNYIVFSKIIPSKSNMWFEFYLSNVADKDGILSASTLSKHHPYTYPGLCAEIKKEGEIAWIKKYEGISRKYIKENTSDFHRKIANRFFNIFVYQVSSWDKYICGELCKIPKEDISILKDQKLLDNLGIWNCDLNEAEFSAKIDSLPLHDKPNIMADYSYAKKRVYKIDHSKKFIIFGVLTASLPTISLLLIWFFYFKNKPEFVICLTLLYVLFFLPYAYLSHHERYQAFMIPIQIFMITIGFSKIFPFSWKK